MEQPRRWKSRPQEPIRPPTTLTEIARRYHGAALALSKTLGLPLADVLKDYSAAVSCIFIEAGKASVVMPGEVRLPPLGQAQTLPLATPADPKPVPPTPAPQAHESTAQKPQPPKPAPKEDGRDRLIEAIKETLFSVDDTGQLHWKTGMKAHAERHFSSFKWAEIRALDLGTLEANYAKLIVALAPKVEDEPEPEDDVPDEAPNPPFASSSAPGGGGASPPPKGAPEIVAPEANGNGKMATLTAEQDALRDEAIAYGIPQAEAERILRGYSFDHAKEMIQRSIQMRRKIAHKGELLASA